MHHRRTLVLTVALAVGSLVVAAGPAAAQPEFVLQTDWGSLLELIVGLFDIEISIRG